MILMVLIGLILPPLLTVALTRGAAAQGDGHAAHAEATTPVPGNALFPVGDDLAEAVARAHREGRSGVAVLFEMNGCGDCARLRAGVLTDPALRGYYQRHFVTIGVYADESRPLRTFDGTTTTSAELARGQRVFALPTMVLFGLDGIPLVRKIGGKAKPDFWIRMGRYVTERGYEETPFAYWRPTL
ncbi:thioredoxin family protein [Thiocapsa rosea]|nr:thioredoxin fold domain-containing protein [Thiocapsa rosea]